MQRIERGLEVGRELLGGGDLVRGQVEIAGEETRVVQDLRGIARPLRRLGGEREGEQDGGGESEDRGGAADFHGINHGWVSPLGRGLAARVAFSLLQPTAGRFPAPSHDSVSDSGEDRANVGRPELATDAAVRLPSGGGGADGGFRRLGDAGPVHRGDRGAPRRAHRGRAVRRLPHGRGAGEGGWRRGLPAAPHPERRLQARPRTAHYSGLLTDQGTYVDDILIYRLAPEDFMVVVNASNAPRDFEWIAARAKGVPDVEVTNES